MSRNEERHPKFQPPKDGEKCPHCGMDVQQTDGLGGDLYRCVSTTCGKWLLTNEVVRHADTREDTEQ